ncbi:hypothetical protein VCHENC02_1123, partial [Vibrio harveyi]
MNRLSKSIF